MEQIYFDEIHKKGNDGKSVFLKTLIIAGCVVLCPVVFLLGGSFGLLLAVGVIYGAYLLFQRLNKEFEYIYTNGEVDIDVIFGRSSRKRLITLKASLIERMAPCGETFESYRKKQGIQVVDYSDGNKKTAHYVLLNGEQKKLVLFSPSERLVENLKPYLRERYFIHD